MMSLVANGDCSRKETNVARIPVRLPACLSDLFNQLFLCGLHQLCRVSHMPSLVNLWDLMDWIPSVMANQQR